MAQRPDIREAEAQLASAYANVVVARAQYLPSVTLTREGGYESAVLKTLLRPESALYSFAAGLTQPIFQGARLLGNLNLQECKQEELLNPYRKAVLSGFSDVETVLANVRLTAGRERLQRAVETSSRQAYDVSEQRLREGTWTRSRSCRRSRRSTPPSTRWSLPGSRMCRPSRVFIRRSAAAGCPNRSWKSSMHGELPKRDTQLGARSSLARRVMSWLFVLIAAGAALYYVFFIMGSPQQRPFGRGRFAASDAAVPVLAAEAKTADVPVTIAAVGTTQALNTVTVRSQVDGKLLSVDVKEGQDVKKGDVLARIDPVTFQAALNQAMAKKAQDEAQLANSKLDLERYERLAASNAINKQQADTQRALVAQNTALVQSDAAAIENAQATLSYTTIVAPLDGRTGLRQVDPGNIIHTSDAGGVVVITQMKPISVVFTIPQQDVQRVNEAFAKGPLRTDALRPDSNQVVETGKLTVVDNQVDASTGTVKLKAEFPNSNLALWPGQFVNVRLTVDTLKGVIVVPTSAVQRGPNGTFVYLVSGGNKAVMRAITVQKQDENQAVIASGVNPSDRVVTTGFVQLTDGKAVSVGGDNSLEPNEAQGSSESAAAPTQTQAPQASAPAQPGATGQWQGQQHRNGERRRGEGGGRRGTPGAQ